MNGNQVFSLDALLFADVLMLNRRKFMFFLAQEHISLYQD